MSGRVWYVDAARQRIDWTVAVVDNVATVDIWKVQERTDGNISVIFARTGRVLNPFVVTQSQAEASSDPVPAADGAPIDFMSKPEAVFDQSTLLPERWDAFTLTYNGDGDLTRVDYTLNSVPVGSVVLTYDSPGVLSGGRRA